MTARPNRATSASKRNDGSAPIRRMMPWSSANISSMLAGGLVACLQVAPPIPPGCHLSRAVRDAPCRGAAEVLVTFPTYWRWLVTWWRCMSVRRLRWAAPGQRAFGLLEPPS